MEQAQATQPVPSAELSKSNNQQAAASGSRASKSRSASVSRPRSAFTVSETYLAQCAADAYKENAAYTSIERETLSAIAPFIDLHKKEETHSEGASRGDGRASTVEHGGYIHGHAKDSSSSTIDASSDAVIGKHRRSSSASSMTFEDFRRHAQTIPNLPGALLEHKLPRRMTTSGIQGYKDIEGILRGLALTPSGAQLAALPQYQFSQFAKSDLIASAEQQHILQRRLRSLSQGNARMKPSLPTIDQVPDSAFTLTKFIREAVNNWAPTSQELDEKFRLRKEIEVILQAMQPTAYLVTFGSVATGLALANADMDLMVIDNSEDALHDVQIDMPALLYEALRSHGYAVKLFAKARIPVVKVQREYVGGTFSIDICFDNPLALHNTRLIASYAACDARMPTLLMFVKIWARSRKINDAFNGTLKSYGYMLLLIYFLQNKTSPCMLPNLQIIGPGIGKKISSDELECCGYDIWFFKNVEQIIPVIQQNTSSMGELMEGFFNHFAYEFDYRDWVVSIRVPGGLQTKEAKHWTQMVEHLNDRGDAKVKDRYILSIEDPFEITHNVARTVTRAGLYEMRGEFMHSVRCIRGNKLQDMII